MVEPTEDTIVISGISCRLPQSDNMKEFRNNLMEGVDMVTEDISRGKPELYGLPKRFGFLKTDLSRFDAPFFGVHPKQANRMDPQLRILHEVTYEAIIDAGFDPREIRGYKTGVFIGCTTSEAHDIWTRNASSNRGYTLTGCAKTMFPNRLSYCFNFTGPSICMDTACSSTLITLDEAVRSIKAGLCDAAVVGGCNLCLTECTSTQFHELGMLSPDGKCKSFDSEANGYVRSEGITAIYIQKRSTAKRIYCTILHSKANCDGFKEEGITIPSSDRQKGLLLQLYEEASVHPASVSYIEAHGTGTKVGDPAEMKAICDVFCKDRLTPLKVGSVKSNMGHSEPVAGLASLAKVIIAMQEKVIPANLHYKTPNPDIPGLIDGRLEVVYKNTDWKPGLVGVNSFGFGGSNCHVLLQAHSSTNSVKAEESSPKRELFLYSGRTADGLKETLQTVFQENLDRHSRFLLNETAHQGTERNPFRGFVVLNGSGDISVEKAITQKLPVWYVFSGMGSQWSGMAKDMMEIDIFKSSIQKSASVLEKYGFNLLTTIAHANEQTFEKPTEAFVAISAIQVALVDLLTEMGIKPDGIIGHSVGELGCAYADGCFSNEETVLAAFWRGQCIERANLPDGGMAAVGLTWKEALVECPEDVVVACHNSSDNVTVSGPKQTVNMFVSNLQAKGVFAKEIKCSNIAFHSAYMEIVAEDLKALLQTVIKSPKPRSSRWISSSVTESCWESNLAKYSSADYHVHNLVSPVLFQEALQHVPPNALVIEIGPHSILQAILKRSLPSSCSIVGLMKMNAKDNVEEVFTALGKCYQHGLIFNPLKLRTLPTAPVPPGTAMISPLVRWDHSQTWELPTQLLNNIQYSYSYDIDISPGSEYSYLVDHKIDGRIIFPASGYLYLVWKSLALQRQESYEHLPVQFNNVELMTASLMTDEDVNKFEVKVIQETGHFTVTQGDTIKVKGTISVLDEDIGNSDSVPTNDEETTQKWDLGESDIYKRSRMNGLEYGPEFRGLLGINVKGLKALCRWNGNWVVFMDQLLQFRNTLEGLSACVVPRVFTSVTINPIVHSRLQQKAGQGLDILNVASSSASLPSMFCPGGCHFQKKQRKMVISYNKNTDTCSSGGVTVIDMKKSVISRLEMTDPILQKHTFVPYMREEPLQVSEELKIYASSCDSLSSNCMALISKNKQCKSKLVVTLQKKSGLYSESYQNIETLISSENDIYLSFIKKLMRSRIRGATLETVPDNFLHDRQRCLTSDNLLNALKTTSHIGTCMGIVIENTIGSNLDILEVNDRGILRKISALMKRTPQVRVRYAIAAENEKESLGDQTEFETIYWSLRDKKTSVQEKKHLVILDNVLHEMSNINVSLERVLSIVADNGFALIHERTQNFHLTMPLDFPLNNKGNFTDLQGRSNGIYCSAKKWRETFETHNLEIIFERSDPFLSSLFLVRLKRHGTILNEIVNVTEPSCKWLAELKEVVNRNAGKPNDRRLWLFANNTTSGILGLVNCLRREPGGEFVRCIFYTQDDPPTNLDCVPSEIALKDLVMNVYKDGIPGSYRHAPLDGNSVSLTTNAVVNLKTEGVLSSLRWIESPMKENRFTGFAKSQPEKENDLRGKEICAVQYASLNFRDVMLATGKLPTDSISGTLDRSSMMGLEFSGYDRNGHRVMGIVSGMGLASTVEVNRSCLWHVPDNWTLEEAATVPVVYSTAYYALVIRGNIQNGETILIHSGSGGVGQAAIAIALHYKCTIYTTVGTEEKKEFLMKKFPELNTENIFSSRNTSFENKIKNATNGKGVGIVLNSLAEEKLQAGIRVLALNGRFLEIGKFDLSMNTPIGLSVFLKNSSFHGIVLDALIENDNTEFKKISKAVEEGMRNGIVTPLNTTIFKRNEIEEAFRYMSSGRHVGKVLIKIKDEEETVEPQIIPAVRRTYFYPEKCYIITGGLGGFGLELAAWISNRGARKIILTSRTGVKTGYQRHLIQILENAGTLVTVSNRDISKEEEARMVLQETNGYPVGGIFNLAAVLNDALLENQTDDGFKKVLQPKVFGTMNLDKYSRQLCRQTCDWFVVFSSISSGFGNAGQTNYGFANSAMERICEKRLQDGLPGLAIQWGPIGDVGVFFETIGDNRTEIAGLLPQRMNSCLTTLDDLLNQPEAVVTSYVLADIKDESKLSTVDELEAAVCRILGIKDPSTIESTVTLGELGIDSLLAIEVMQTLEKKFNVTKSAREIRELSFSMLRQFGGQIEEEIKVPNDKLETLTDGYFSLEIIIKLNDNVSANPPLYIVHPLIGRTDCLKSFASKLHVPVFGIQCVKDVPVSSLQDIAEFYLKAVEHHKVNLSYHLAGYSFGACIAFEMAIQGQDTPKYGKPLSLTLLDGSVTTVKKAANLPMNSPGQEMISTLEVKDGLSLKTGTMEMMSYESPNLTAEEIELLYEEYIKKIFKCGVDYEPSHKLEGDVHLISPENGIRQLCEADDMGLGMIVSGEVKIYTVPGNHESFIQLGNENDVADVVNPILTNVINN